MTTFTILLTGSRDWADKEMLWVALDSLALGAKEAGFTDILVRHGACYPKPEYGLRELKSADWLAHLWTLQPKRSPLPVDEDEMPANWQKFGRRAGFVRNQKLVDRGADVCLSANTGETRGTQDCTDRAEAAGIPVMPLVPRSSPSGKAQSW